MSDALGLDDGLPLVGEDSGNRSMWIGLAAIGAVGLLLFSMLEANRQTSAEPVVPSPADYATATVPRPRLAIPPIAETLPPGYARPQPDSLRRPANVEQQSMLPPVRLAPARRTEAPLPSPFQQVPQPFTPAAPFLPTAFEPGRSAPVIVHDNAQAAYAAPTDALTPATTNSPSAKAMAVRGGDRTYLVSQGTLILAVLETAIDSTQSGQVRAMVSTNVFNGLATQVLIPKGSRIFGEYKSDMSSGQNRARIIWTRLVRPDGATIALDSPASDQLGRSGVKGRVDTHFGERLLNALLQSTINFGTYAASRSVTNNDGVIIALPNGAQSVGSQILTEVPRPTLTVRHGTGISVFVARDLDFSAVE